MRLNSAWRETISKWKRESFWRELSQHAERMTDEMNLRLLLEQEPVGEILFVEKITVTSIRRKRKEETWRWKKIMEWKEKIFSDKLVNSGRQQEVDLARALLVICLAPVHCIIECTPGEQLARGIPFLLDSVIGGPLGAPVFMFAMGIGMAYTRQFAPVKFVRRGMGLGMLGLWLNICRFLLPFLAGYGITGDTHKYIAPLPYRIFGNDILQFACLTMLLAALFFRLHIPDSGLVIICLGMSLLGTWLNGTDLGSPVANILLGHIIGIEDAAGMVISDFPIMNWLLVPVSGYLFGKRLQYVKNKNLFYGFFSVIGALIAAVCFTTGIRDGRGMFGEGQNCYYHIVTRDCLISLASVMGILGGCHAAVQVLPDKVMDLAAGISRRTSVIYCIQWMLVMTGTNVILYILRGTQILEVPQTILLGAGISILSIGTACLSVPVCSASDGGGNEQK